MKNYFVNLLTETKMLLYNQKHKQYIDEDMEKKLGLIDKVVDLYQGIPDKLQRSVLQEAMVVAKAHCLN